MNYEFEYDLFGFVWDTRFFYSVFFVFVDSLLSAYALSDSARW